MGRGANYFLSEPPSCVSDLRPYGLFLAAAAALLLWCFVHLTRLYFAVYQQPDVITEAPITDAPTSLLAERLKLAHDNFSKSAHSGLGLFMPIQRRAFWFALAAGAVLCGLLRVNVHLKMID